jgi:hypothetical protein
MDHIPITGAPNVDEEIVIKKRKRETKVLNAKDQRKIVRDITNHILPLVEAKVDEWVTNNRNLFRNRPELKRFHKKNEVKDITEPKKPGSAFMLFKQERRNFHKSNGSLSRESALLVQVAAEWRSLSETDKQRYEKLYSIRQEQYESEWKLWREKKDRVIEEATATEVEGDNDEDGNITDY